MATWGSPWHEKSGLIIARSACRVGFAGRNPAIPRLLAVPETYVKITQTLIDNLVGRMDNAATFLPGQLAGLFSQTVSQIPAIPGSQRPV